jgi:hypothetical protein
MHQLNNEVNLSHAIMREHIMNSSLSNTTSGATSMINKETSHLMIKK